MSDAATTSAYTDDIKGTSSAVPGNTGTYDYTYDQVGNLMSDRKEFIQEIKWTADRKIKEIVRDAVAMFAAGKNLPDLVFEYDANRQRVVKKVIPRNNTAPYARKAEQDWTVTYYVRDATGNIMTTYEKSFSPATGQNFNYHMAATQYNIYGSQRLGTDEKPGGGRIGGGLFNSSTGVYSLVSGLFTGFEKVKHQLGDAHYELSNHLGNVVATVSDRKLMETGNSSTELISFESGTHAGLLSNQGSVSAPYVQRIGQALVQNPNSSMIRMPVTAGVAISAAVYAKNPVSTAAELRIEFWNLSTNASAAINQVAIPVSSSYNLVTLNVTTPANLGSNLEARIYVRNTAGNYTFIDDLTATRTDNSSLSFNYYIADVKETHDYYPFGSPMPGREFGSGYRYGFNGKENDNEVKGNGNSLDFGERIYDPRLGRWLSVDPLAGRFAGQSPYSAMDNNPTNIIDPDGRSGEPVMDRKAKTITVSSNLIMYGGSASAALAKSTAKDIQDKWNAAGGKVNIGGVEYKVKFSVTGTYDKNVTKESISKNTDIKNNYIRVEETVSGNISYMDGAGSNTGYYKLGNIQADGSTTEAHEFGHGYGLDHPEDGDLRGEGQPGIMAARGSIVDPAYQYNPKAKAGEAGGTLSPETRKVTQKNIDALGLDKVKYDKNGKGKLGAITNEYHEKTK